MVSAAEPSKEKAIIRLRPTASEIQAIIIKKTDRLPVANETVRLAADGVVPKTVENSGIRGWVQYSTAKVTKLPKNRARIARQYPLSPCRI